MNEQKTVSMRIDGQVAVLRLPNPPANEITDALRKNIYDYISQADENVDIKAIVLMGAQGPFSAGLGVDRLCGVDEEPSLNKLCDRIELCKTPVVYAMCGAIFGDGLAIALACHYRIIGEFSRCATFEVTLGGVPGGGVTQRLPRLVGADHALDILLSGTPINSKTAVKIGLADEVAKNRTGIAALEFANNLIATGALPRPTRDAGIGLSDGAKYFATITRRREATREAKLDAPRAIIDCVEAALMMPFDVGLEREIIARADCLVSPQAEALQHAYRAEQGVEIRPDHDVISGRMVSKISVVGTGPVGIGLTFSALDHGLSVDLLGGHSDELVYAEQKIVTAYTRLLQQGKITEKTKDDCLSRLSATVSLTGLQSSQVIVDTTETSIRRRVNLLSRLEDQISDDAILATVADRGFVQLSTNLARPERFVGFHFFPPVSQVPVVELVRPDAVDPTAYATSFEFLRKIGKRPVTVAAKDGLVANAILAAATAAVDVILLMGARPAQIDHAMTEAGFSVGPCRAMDQLGLSHDVGAVARYLVSYGRSGQATGGGFFDYCENSNQMGDDHVAENLIAGLRKEGGITPQKFTDQDVFDRIVLAMANAGAQALYEGTALRPVDIDTLMISAKGFPRKYGGPMKYADLKTPLQVEKKLHSFAQSAPDIWHPSPVWRELIKNGNNFEILNNI